MEAQSSPHNEKPASDLNALFEELEKKQSQRGAPAASVPPRSVPSAHALVSKPRTSAPPPPPSLRASERSREVAERIDDAELIEEVSDVEATAKHASSEPVLPTYDAELDDAPTVARSSPLSQLSLPIPSRRPTPPPGSVRLPPPPSVRQSVSPSSVARLSAPAAPLSSTSNVPVPSARSLPALTPPPASRRSMPVASRPPMSAPVSAVSQPVPTAPPISLPSASVVVSEPAPATRTPASTSIPPVARSDSHTVVTRRKQGSNAALFAALGGFAMLALLAGGAFAFKDRLLGASSAQGALIVTAAGPNDAPVSGVRVLVDGKEACSSSPCRVDLDTGTHFVRVEAPGFVTTADRAVSIAGGESSVHIALSPAPGSPNAAAAAPAKAEAEAKTDAPAKESDKEQVADLDKDLPAAAPKAGAAPTKVAAAPKAGAKPADKPADKAEAKAAEPAVGGMGTLNINSIPVANVVLDGRPVGSTPIVGLSVSAGSHSVIFIHPEHGRKATGVKVEAGKTATAAVRF